MSVAPVNLAAVTPRHSSSDRAPRLSRRAWLLGTVGVLVGAAAMATLGFTAERPVQATPAVAVAHPTSTPGQLDTLALTDVRGHKPLAP
jgi:hypothetical protein